MTLLDEPTTSAPPAPETSAPPEAPAEVAARPCGNCGAGLADDQDWCLTCGTAAPGRLGSRAPWRSAAAVAGLTLALVGGASAAAYAALQQDAAITAGAPAPASAAPVQQAAAAVPTPPAPILKPKVPKTSASDTTVPDPVDTPSTPAVDDTAGDLPADTTSDDTTGDGTGTGTGSDTTTDDTDTKTDTSAATPTTPVDPTLPRGALKTITLPGPPATPAAVYDPLEQVKTPGDPALAVDGDLETDWVAAPKLGKTIRIGLRIDLGSRQVVRALRVTTDTPGFGLETYASDTSAVPPTISDTRWEPANPETTVEGGSTVIKLDKPGRYRQVVLWLTTPPEVGRTVHLTELKLLG